MLALVDALFIEHVKLCHQVDYAVSWPFSVAVRVKHDFDGNESSLLLYSCQ